LYSASSPPGQKVDRLKGKSAWRAVANNDNNILTNDKSHDTVEQSKIPSEVSMTLKQGSTLFLKIVISLIGTVTFAGLIWFPQTEGRAADLDLVSIYADPLIIYTFIGSIPFFVALSQGFKLLGHVDHNRVFSPSAVKAVRNIKYCAIATAGLIVLGLLFIRFFASGEDAAGPTALGMVTTFASIVIATGAAVFQRLLQNAVDLKSENDLTV
jgi:hypothetical protein